MMEYCLKDFITVGGCRIFIFEIIVIRLSFMSYTHKLQINKGDTKNQ